MGGPGSGRTGGRSTYEGTGSFRLSTTLLRRAGLHSGPSNTATINFSLDDKPFEVVLTANFASSYIELTHYMRTYPWGEHRYRVQLLTTPQSFGGVRWWFACPRTGMRSTCLFLPLGGHEFWSRSAWRLGYASQREGQMGRIDIQAQKAFQRLGGKGSWREAVPARPKWMRARTFAKKLKRLEELNDRFEGEWVKRASQLIKAVNTKAR